MEVQLSKLVLGESDPVTVFFEFGPHFRSVQCLKATLRVHVAVRDFMGLTIERLEQEVLCETKVKPLLQREQIVIGLANYKDIVRKARREYQLDLQLGESPLIKNEFGVKPLNHKRVALDLGEIPKRPGQMLFRGPQNNFFAKQALHCLELASCNGAVIQSSFSVEVEIECSQMFFGKKTHSISYPVHFYTDPKGRGG